MSPCRKIIHHQFSIALLGFWILDICGPVEFTGFLCLRGVGGGIRCSPHFGKDGESAPALSPKADGGSESAGGVYLSERRPCPEKPLFFPPALFLRGGGEAGGHAGLTWAMRKGRSQEYCCGVGG